MSTVITDKYLSICLSDVNVSKMSRSSVNNNASAYLVAFYRFAISSQRKGYSISLNMDFAIRYPQKTSNTSTTSVEDRTSRAPNPDPMVVPGKVGKSNLFTCEW